MTIDELKKHFGEKIIEPNLKFFYEDTSKFSKNPRISKTKLKHQYWYYYTGYQPNFVEQFGKTEGWVLGTVVFRRHGVSFMRFERSKDKNFEVEFFDGSIGTQKLIPAVISKKEFKNYNPEFNFIFKDMNGLIKFE